MNLKTLIGTLRRKNTGIRVLSGVLAVLTLVSSFALGVNAADSVKEYTYDTTSQKETYDYLTGKVNASDNNSYATVVVDTPEEKLETMDLRYAAYGYELYVDEYSGEIAVLNTKTGESLFSNPYDVGPKSKAVKTVKQQLLSQVSVKYTVLSDNTSGQLWSFTDASQYSQTKTSNIRGGIRVEYTIGQQTGNQLLPMWISEERFNEVIYEPMVEELGEGAYDLRSLTSFYTLKDPEKAITEDERNTILKEYPCTKNGMAIYVFDTSATLREQNRVINLIKTYTEYNYEDLAYDHELTEYEYDDTPTPVFSIALEYTLNENGLQVECPAAGIRFDESNFRIDSLYVLPFIGAGNSVDGGYTFLPDGSGALFDFADLSTLATATSITERIYGADYAYLNLAGMIAGVNWNQVTFPVFGVIRNEKVTENGVTSRKKSGYVGIVTEGDALMDVTTYHGGRVHEYNSIQMGLYPRATDSYEISDFISVGSNASWSVTSSRKYTGSFTVQYIMLTDDNVAKAKKLGDDYYTASWFGMAEAYRDHLVDTGVLTKLTEADVKKDIPLYLETFGAVETTVRYMTFPIQTLVDMTSFEDIMTMYGDLSEAGISNVNFKLTGYANGGMESTVPYKLKWESVVGGKDGLELLLADANAKDYGVYPDFDFVYINNTEIFDGISRNNHAAKTINNRYCSRRVYQSTAQYFVNYFQLAISSSVFTRLYEKFLGNYDEYDFKGISVSTLGSDLNSDFDEDDPYSREDSKAATIAALSAIKEQVGSVMTDIGNAYTWPYVDHILNLNTDSSHMMRSAATVPFLGVVLHGYMQYAGAPMNMEGNTDTAVLKALENGAGLYFILSMKNTDILKEWRSLSKYYSVRYDIWFDDLVSLYEKVNAVLADVQTSEITSHEFVVGTRVPDAVEVELDMDRLVKDMVAAQEQYYVDLDEAARLQILNARMAAYNGASIINKQAAAINDLLAQLDAKAALVTDGIAAAKTAAEVTTLVNDVYATAYRLETAYAAVVAANKAAADGHAYLKSRTDLNYDLTALAAQGAAAAAAAAAKVPAVAAKVQEVTTAVAAAAVAYNATITGNYAAYVAAQPVVVPESTDVKPVDVSMESAKYEIDNNQIVYMTYENGTAFILNYNSYAVLVDIDGITYSVDAYGYKVIQ